MIKVAVVGATGLVGSKILSVLEERKFPISNLMPVASEKSKGKEIIFNGKSYVIQTAEEAIIQRPQLALFSAGSKTSLNLAPLFAEAGCKVIDNSSAWRMDSQKKLIVPEVNANVLTKEDMIIANPNCSTIQMVVVLQPLHRLYKIQRVVVSTYQSVTGSGIKAVEQLEAECKGNDQNIKKAYPYPIDRNLIPQIDVFTENGYTKEEIKMINETQKIMQDDTIRLTATAVRVPVIGGHSESINIQFEKNVDISSIRKVLENESGITLQDKVDDLVYPMPLFAHDKDDVFVGRIRKDESQKNTINIWVVSDNLRKGAATNAIQIAEYLYQKKWL